MEAADCGIQLRWGNPFSDVVLEPSLCAYFALWFFFLFCLHLSRPARVAVCFEDMVVMTDDVA